jgi:hypothetical protein
MTAHLSAESSTSEVYAPVIDWANTPLTQDFEGHYVKIIDDLFTPKECAELISLAESDAEWKEAAVHYGLGANDSYVDKDYRNNERILRFDKPAAEKLYQKLRPYVQELARISAGDKWEGIVLSASGRVDGTWECVGYVLFIPCEPTRSDPRHSCPDSTNGLAF